MGIPDHLTLSPEKPVWGSRSNSKKLTWNGLVQNQDKSTTSLYIVTLFNFYDEYIMWNAGLDESQAGIKTAGRNMKNIRYADNTMLMAGGEDKLEKLFLRVKEVSDKTGLKLNI